MHSACIKKRSSAQAAARATLMAGQTAAAFRWSHGKASHYKRPQAVRKLATVQKAAIAIQRPGQQHVPQSDAMRSNKQSGARSSRVKEGFEKRTNLGKSRKQAQCPRVQRVRAEAVSYFRCKTSPLTGQDMHMGNLRQCTQCVHGHNKPIRRLRRLLSISSTQVV